jgi:Protein of unknown function (DUF4240)
VRIAGCRVVFTALCFSGAKVKLFWGNLEILFRRKKEYLFLSKHYLCSIRLIPMSHIIQLRLNELGPDFIRDMKQQYPDADLQIIVEERPEKSSGMDDTVFWSLIDAFDWSKTGNDDAVMEPAIASLADMSESAIYAFSDILSHKLWLLDTEAHARLLIANHPEGYLSVDEFLYIRCCVVANGQSVFEDILQHPEKMPDLTFEGLLNLADLAYSRKTGREMDHIAAYNYETYSNENGWI